MVKGKSMITEEILIQYDQVIATVPGIERKGVTMPYTSMNGNMYTMLRKDGVLGIRLSKEDSIAFIEEYNSKPFENYGSLIKEYVEVPLHVFMDTELMSKYMNMAHQYAKTLKPKPTKKKKESKAKSETTEEKKVTWLIGETYKNGQAKATLKGDMMTHFFEDGTIKAEGNILSEKMEGKWTFYKKGGHLMQIGHFKKDIKHGEWVRYDSQEKVVYHVEFENGKIIKKYV